MKSSFKVMVRVRPILGDEDEKVSVRVDGKRRLTIRSSVKTFQCEFEDDVLNPDDDQKRTFSKVKECVDSALGGFNSTIFAYGQTGSGKTYTLFGKEGIDLEQSAHSQLRGIAPRSVERVFERLPKGTRVQACFLQVYNEHLYDLLLDPRMARKLTIREDKHHGIHVEGISMYPVTDAQECLRLLQIGNEHRITRETRMNKFSSRSHSIFQLTLERKGDNDSTIFSKLNLVDLAGSEKWDLRGMVEDHVAELTNINLSLHTLGRVIEALTSKVSYVPYRESILTRLLTDSLGGNTKTCLIATISPSVSNAFETISTVKFAERAKNVTMTLRINKIRKIDIKLVEKLEREIESLREKLLLGDNGNRDFRKQQQQQHEDDNDERKRLRDENRELRQKLAVASMTSSSSSLQKNSSTSSQEVNERVIEIVDKMYDACEKFFRLEIEEEDLRKHVKQCHASVKKYRTQQETRSSSRSPKRRTRQIRSSPASFGRNNISPRHLSSMFHNSPRRTDFITKLKKNSNSSSSSRRVLGKYRISGRSSQEYGKFVDPYEEKAKRRDGKLKRAEENLKRQELMMQWAQKKAQQKLENIDREIRHRETQRKHHEEKERRWKEHARQQKEKVNRWRSRMYSDLDLYKEE